MDMILRGAAVYVFVWLFFRLSGRRTMAQITPFDFVLLLICGEATQQALLGDDFSTTNAAIVVLTLIGIETGMTAFCARFPRFERIMDGIPLVLVQNGAEHRDRMEKERVDHADILQEARSGQGLARFDQIEHAVMETSGEITVIPRKS